MILFALRCAADHTFDAWFRDGAAYEALAAAAALTCPVCGRNDVSKAVMAPRILRARASSPETARTSAPAATLTPPGAPSPAAGETPPQTPAAPTEPAPTATPAPLGDVARHLAALRRLVETSCDYVGDRFPEEARRIHYGETDSRPIYGRASPKEVSELIDEGVTIHRVPGLRRTDS